MNYIKIHYESGNETIAFAAEELARYFQQMQPGAFVEQREWVRYVPHAGDGIWLGCFAELSAELPVVADPAVDDAISIHIEHGKGAIVGTNARSVLIGVYRFLREAGCLFLRPGLRGEWIPHKDVDSLTVQCVDCPDCRHRGICIEGAVAYENVRDIIDWIPKNGMNAYFIQFAVPHTFFDRWYRHLDSTVLQPEPFELADSARIAEKLGTEIKKRGLLYHAVGHGWTCEPFGVTGGGWEVRTEAIPEEFRAYLAQIDGKRELFEGIPLNTNLCYSNPEVQKRVTQAVAEYCVTHPQVDFLHMWLADASNNHCECESCAASRPADLYIQLLNQVDALLTEKGISTKIVFLLYYDLLWEPEKETIKNPDRFVLMFAPITRTYSDPLQCGPYENHGALAPYIRNHLEAPSSVSENLVRLSLWKRHFSGDSFLFDYHFMWDHFKDPLYYDMAKVLSEDLKYLSKIGLNGFVSCQCQRTFFPTGFPMAVLAELLWDSKRTKDDIEDAYFTAAFGEGRRVAQEYFQSLSGLFDPIYLRGEKGAVDSIAARNFRQIPAVIENHRETLTQWYQNERIPCRKESWRLLLLHAAFCVPLSNLLAAVASGAQAETVAQEWEAVRSFVWQHEIELQEVFDAYLFLSTYRGILSQFGYQVGF